MATQTRVVQAGDTVSKIAKEFGVPTSAVTGFRSNDPNTIFAGETLSIQVPDVPQDVPGTQGTALSVNSPSLPQNGAPGTVQTSTPQSTTPTFADAPQPAQPQPSNITQDGTALQPAPTGPATAQTTGQAPSQPEAPSGAGEVQGQREVTLPNGLGVTIDGQGNIIDEAGEVVTDPGQDEAQTFFDNFGLSSDAIGQGFATNPFGTLQSIVESVMQLVGLDGTNQDLTETANQIESLENERDAEIEKINDDPFRSAGTKARAVQQVQDRFANRINARVNKLTLLQNAETEAREQARFVASTAIGLFNKEREFQADQIEAALDRAEKQREAERLAGPLTTENVGGFQVLRDASGKVVSTKQPVSDGLGGGVGSGGLVDTVFDNPFLYNQFTPSTKAKIAPALRQAGFEFPRDLTPAQEEAANDANAALIKLADIENAVFNDAGGIDRGALVAAISGRTPLAFSRNEVLDLISRMRTGAALTVDEEKFYRGQLPRFTDDEETIKDKIDHWKTLFAGVAGASIVLQLSDGSVVEAKDMFDQQTRGDVRNAISNGATVIEIR